MPIKLYEVGSQLILPVVFISKAIPYLLHGFVSIDAMYSLSAGSLAQRLSRRGWYLALTSVPNDHHLSPLVQYSTYNLQCYAVKLADYKNLVYVISTLEQYIPWYC